MKYRVETFIDFSNSPIYKRVCDVFYAKTKEQILTKMDEFYRKEWLVRFINREPVRVGNGYDFWYWDKFLKRPVRVYTIVEKPWVPDFKF